ncbi:MAG: hypothetical protein RIQ89_569, partial [Bacteroidota bacterium]
IVALLLMAQFVSGQHPADNFSHLIDSNQLRQKVYDLAGTEFEGRNTAEPGQKKAAAYIANFFSQIGLAPIVHQSYYQSHALSKKISKKKAILINGKEFIFLKDYFYIPGFNDTTIVLDQILFCGYGIDSIGLYNDFEKITIEDKAILIFDTEPHNDFGKSKITKSWNQWSIWSNSYNYKLNKIAEKKPAAVFIITDVTRMIDSLNYTDVVPRDIYHANISPVPFIYISYEMAQAFFGEGQEHELEALINRCNKLKPQSQNVVVNSTVRLFTNTETLTGDNVIGYLEGSDAKEEVIFVTAHYDHLGANDTTWFPGADDNATGTAAVMQIAKTMTTAALAGYQPRRSIVFMCVSGEERGLLGSKYYVEHPIIPLENTMCNLNIDMIGRTDPRHDSIDISNYVYIIGSDKLSTDLHYTSEAANKRSAKLFLDYKYNATDDPNRYYYRSDHYNFIKNGIPAIFYFSGVHADYHKPTDTAEKINYTLLQKRTALVYHTLWDLANKKDALIIDVATEPEE